MKRAPERPPRWQERVGLALFRALAPRLPDRKTPAAPAALAPFEDLLVSRKGGAGGLSATWFPANRTPRGAVLLLHPWLVWGRTYFHRRGRIQALREAGYHALAIDFPGFGDSAGPNRLYDRYVESALELLARPCYLFFRRALPAAYRYLDARRHAEAFDLGAVTYVSGARDTGVLPEDTHELAERAGGSSRIFEEAGHLGSIKVAREAVIRAALETFERAAARSATAVYEPSGLSAAADGSLSTALG